MSTRRLRPGMLTRRESRAVGRLCALYAVGILGLYLVLPVLSPYAAQLAGQTGLLIGLAIGAYGLTQTIFQVPFGHLSDRIGRKRTIFIGLVCFALGGIVAASSKQIAWLVVGRLLQGVGAIASVVVSLLADLTRPSVRTQAMARLTGTIGCAAAVGVVCGPLLAHFLGVRFIFWATAVLSLAAATGLLLLVPAPRHHRAEEQLQVGDLPTILRQPSILILDLGTFLVHAVVTVLFVLVPFDFHRGLATGGAATIWKVGLPAILIAAGAMAVAARHSDREGHARAVLYLGTGLLLASCLLFAFLGSDAGDAPRLLGVLLGTIVFVLSVALLEPALPSRMSRFAVGKHRGTAMGVFHMSQFLGTFAGGMLGGAFLKSDRTPLFLGLAVASGLWMAAVPAIRERPGLPAADVTHSTTGRGL